MNSNLYSISRLVFSWLILLTIIAASVSDESVLGNAEFENSIELEKEVEGGEKEIEALLLQILQVEQILLDQELVSILYFCKESETTRSPEKLYILYHQFKSHLG